MSAAGEPVRSGPLDRIRLGLSRTRDGILGRLAGLFGAPGAAAGRSADLEAALIEADLGPQAAARIAASAGGAADLEAVREAARRVLCDMLARDAGAPAAGGPPRVILCVGVNGGGKTTTAGKLAAMHGRAGRRVVLCAADTFRAGAGEQLRLWAERTGADFVGGRPGADPSSVVFDALQAAIGRSADVLVVDTAGRLHTREPLMRELQKIVRVVGRRLEGAPHEVLLVLDATTGQNGVAQARQFLEAARVTGLCLTKLDGTARGGVAVRIVGELGIPIRYLGVGEGSGDLVEFDVDEFVDGLLRPGA